MIKELIKKYEFNPRLAGLFINPFYFARKGIWQYFYDNPMYITGKLLDVGCGSKPYREFFLATDYVGMEIQGSTHTAEYYYNGKTFPFPDDEFHTVLCSQVLEHVFNPDEFLSETRRVLKPNGKLILTVPFIWDEHEQPHDYARYTSFGIKHLLEKNGFKVLHHQKSTTGIRAIFQTTNAYLYKQSIPVAYLLSPFINIVGEILGRILPKNDDLYLDNIILARRKT